MSADRDAYRAIPSVDAVLATPPLTEWADAVPRSPLVETVRAVLDDHRRRLAAGEAESTPPPQRFAEEAVTRLHAAETPALRPVVNATGVLLHTGLGRAPMAPVAADAARTAAMHATPVEMDLRSGERSRRADRVAPLLCELTGAEAATVVNNNAAAVLLALATTAAGREVIVSRGELIEIGGSFRLPDVMETSGAVLREVGTTNKTRLADYEGAVGEATAALMKAHRSNYRIVGFTEEVALADLVALARRRSLPVIHDVGSGALRDLQPDGVGAEPTAQASVAAGADLVCFSGDKLLGGPQAGLVVGRRSLVERIERHPLMRAVRVDKVTLAALEATLRLHRRETVGGRPPPVLAMARTPTATLAERARSIAAALRDADAIEHVDTVATTAQVGGGSLPAEGVESVAVHIRPGTLSETALAERLRTAADDAIPVVSRLQQGAVLLDLRTVFPDEDPEILTTVRAALE